MLSFVPLHHPLTRLLRRLSLHRTCGNRDGFTIVEVLIAIALLAAITSVTWASMTNLYRSRDIIASRSERYQEVRGTFDRLSLDISAAFIAGPDLGGEPLPGSAQPETPKDVQAAVDQQAKAKRLPQQYAMIGTQHSINFTSMGHRQTQPNERASFSSEIGYTLRPVYEDGQRLNQLMRREDVTIDDNVQRGGVIFPVLNRIVDLSFEYWDPGQVKLGTYEEIAKGRWVTEWDSTSSYNAARLPSRIRVTLKLPSQSNSNQPETFSTEIPITTTEVMEF